MIGGKYKYINANAPDSKINYSYSKYLGKEFLRQWKCSREKEIKEFKLNDFIEYCKISKTIVVDGYVLAHTLFLKWIVSYDKSRDESDLALLIKRFEVTKKIYFEYDKKMRPKDKDNFLEFENYCLFGIVLGEIFKKNKKYQFLNAHIKINDIILGWKNDIDEKHLLLKSYSLNLECTNVVNILNEKNIIYE